MRIVNHDKDRTGRCGIPEVIYGEGKTGDDLVDIVQRFLAESGRAIVTKIDEVKASKVMKSVDPKKCAVNYNVRGKVLVIKNKDFKQESVGSVGILTAGTSDIPVAEEAKGVAEELGCTVYSEYDVGIAGMHRVFAAIEKMPDVRVLIVIAGMEGALPSVVSGLVSAPVVGVPTSVGYGTAEHGRTALYTMLNSCTPLAVMNIDNGYGAAVLAYKILLSGKDKSV